MGEIIKHNSRASGALKAFDNISEADIINMSNQRIIIREINRLLLRVKGENDFFNEICTILNNYDSAKMIWIGLVENDNHLVKPVAQVGFGDGYLAAIRITWDESEYGKGPTSTAIKKKKPIVINDIENNPIYHPWRDEASKYGYASSIALPLMDETRVIGVLNMYSLRRSAFSEDEIDFLTEIAGDIAVGIKLLRLEKELKQSACSLAKTLESTTEALTLILGKRDPYTASHQQRVSRLACAIARGLNLTDDNIEGIKVAGSLHDIGKVYVPAEILSKPSKLTESEFSIMKTHPQVGYDIIKSIKFPWPVAPVVLQHHERMNGTGYPHGLTGEMITMGAKILAVADVVEAMSSHRPYRPALGIDKALEEISKNRAILYDDNIAGVCLALFTNKNFSFE